MEWVTLIDTQALLYVMALGIPSAWITGWLYRMWRKANMPAILGMISRQRRRDATIKETRERTDIIEMLQIEFDSRLSAVESEMGDKLRDFEGRVGKMETKISQLRNRLRARGIVTDA